MLIVLGYFIYCASLLPDCINCNLFELESSTRKEIKLAQ
jgi:hypothetical protein